MSGNNDSVVNSKNIVLSLYKKYGKLHKKTICEQIKIVNDLKWEYTQAEIKMIRRRLLSSLDHKKETKGFLFQPITILLAMIAAVLPLASKVVEKRLAVLDKDLKIPDEQSYILDELNASVYDFTFNLSALLFTSIGVFWFANYVSFLIRDIKLRSAILIVEESIDDLKSD
ncbi:hypothetical protein [Terribacillus saccharophilus]|uniref:DUF4342 domain-containing protein n=1 Tax=Terribacillus saccharophilus TaxID=361277 RepID=A0ABX4H0T7_9BACI|nr:hypothetical protein [Terribacillus saccharophilus]PAD36320.1 hypothetical protein CHH56_04825 [Terribacillus saccharophilus]PAD95038.1 hypothetical protein CHH50_15660 [Terribacillus saccharophilus]PAE00739.1 hypothetical protein CHH48_05530 [Terribacillus saccharophilus]